MKPGPAQGEFQETDRARLVSRLTAVTGKDLAEREVVRLAEGDLSLIQQLDAPAQQGVMALVNPESLDDEVRGELERIVGPTIDYVSVAFLQRAWAAARSVARVVFLTDRRENGTGVMVSPVLFMTNNHVIPSPEDSLNQLIQFDYELGVDDAPLPITEFRLDPATFWFTSPENELDVTLVAVGRRLSGSRDLSAFGYAPLRSGDDKHAIGDFVTVIEHPEGRQKQIALRENRVIGRGKKGLTLHYGADTLPGASGSPVFNDALELVALHHAGGRRNDDTLETDQPIPSESNEGIRISAIMRRLRTAVDELAVPQRNLLAPALDPPLRGPSLLLSGSPLEATMAVGGLGASGGLSLGTPTGVPVLAGSDGWVRTTLPVQIAIQLPGLVRTETAISSGPTGPVAAAAGILERNEPPDPAYDARRGYSPQFLQIEVPLPALPQSAVNDVVHPKANDVGDNALRYLHFALVQDGRRRMPYFTAVNIDGRRSRNVNRQTGEVEAAETWYEDPRIGEEKQLDQSVFARQQPRIFDRGHMVRRLDPAWGSRSVAKRASDDTFHFTNCCPQVSNFNQSARLWQGIEDYALENARTTDERITVFTGPVFTDEDPEYRGIRVPQSFWKIVVRIDTGELRATGFFASQAELLADALGRVETFAGWGDLGKVKVYQRRVEAISAATKLSFGVLADHDTAGTLETAAVLTSLADVSW